MFVITQTFLCLKDRKKPCRKNPEAVKCAVRHRRCEGCPYNKFFKKEETTKSRK